MTQQLNKVDEEHGMNGHLLVNKDDVLQVARVKEKAIITKEAE